MIKVTTRGVADFDRDMDEAGERFISGVRSLMSDLTRDTATDARHRASKGSLSGRSANSIDVRGDEIQAGRGVPWYGFADFGGTAGIRKSVKRDFIKGGRYLFPAVRDSNVYRRADQMLDKALREVT